jgi:hypothetical protein
MLRPQIAGTVNGASATNTGFQRRTEQASPDASQRRSGMTMSEVTGRRAESDAVEMGAGSAGAEGLTPGPRNAAAAWFATMLGWVLSPPKPGERGLVTVEFIFGIILVIAIVTVVVSVIHRPAMGDFFLKLIQWLLNLIKK